MRLPLLAAAVAALLSGAAPASAQTEYRNPDGSAAYTVPAGIEVVYDTRLQPGQTAFAVIRTLGSRRDRAGVCVLGFRTLGGMPNLDTWAGMIADHRANTEAKARAKAAAPMSFVSLGGYRDLTFRGGEGYQYWFEQREADGRQSSRLIAVGLVRPQSLFGGDCVTSSGLSFTPAEVERIAKLVMSARPS